MHHPLEKIPCENRAQVNHDRRCGMAISSFSRPLLAIAAVAWLPTYRNARQFSVSCMLTGSAAAPEIAVVPIKSAFLALRSVP